MTKKAASSTIEVTLVLERETKNYVVYAPSADDSLLPIHIKKTRLATYPKAFTLTLTPKET